MDKNIKRKILKEYEGKEVASGVYETIDKLLYESDDYFYANGKMKSSKIIYHEEFDDVSYCCDFDETGKLIKEDSNYNITFFPEPEEIVQLEDGAYIEKYSDELGWSENKYDKLDNLIWEKSSREDEPEREFFYTYDNENKCIRKEGTIDFASIIEEYIYNGQCVTTLKVEEETYIPEMDEDVTNVPYVYKFTEIERYIKEDNSYRYNTYACKADSVEDFFEGKYTKVLLEVEECSIEEIVEGDKRIKTIKNIVNDCIQKEEIFTISLETGEVIRNVKIDYTLGEKYIRIEEYECEYY